MSKTPEKKVKPLDLTYLRGWRDGFQECLHDCQLLLDSVKAMELRTCLGFFICGQLLTIGIFLVARYG